ncbi:Oidioi.mRNA.OKI2018_I69.chr1.g3709.t1.cds [Oikopleura dioica]|uniref:Oidioi.mRNA.OKI2018_I69.chr1.g3709.t1.cds n=1 Tax=Oikopleura dioica TaxID=34765 RepID=A0ABN7T464_OIKDI|nr:Oidioi.mRNA.OKI2018_I69.chr1.g3709.t1.cds [Oikopleura dioica]
MDSEKVLREATKFFERDETDPITTFAIDEYLTSVSISLPALILAVAIFLGGDMYSVDGLQVFNPNRYFGSSPPYKSYHFETWNQIPFLRKYCWAKLSNMECGVETILGNCEESQNLWHYAILPKFLFLIIVLMYTTKIIWNTNVAKDLANILNFIIGATEESIRDLVGDLAKEAEVEDNEENKKKDPALKYQQTNLILHRLNNTNSLALKFVFRRLYFILLVAVAVYLTYFFYIDPARNPVEFECGLPEWLHFQDFPSRPTDEEHRNLTGLKIIKTIHAVYEPVNRRTILMVILGLCFNLKQAILYIIVGITAVVSWLVESSENQGAHLLKMLPGLKIPQVKRYSDLDFILLLLHTNRSLSQYLKLSFDIMISSNGKKTQSTFEKHQKFISSLREITVWKTTTENDDAIEQLLKKRN